MITTMKARGIKFILMLAAVAFVAVYSYISWAAPLRFNSPDENANYYFIGNFVETGWLYAFEPLNLVTPGLIHPRSISVVDDFLVPGGFIGLPVFYGAAAKVLGLGATPFLTAILAVAAALAFASVTGKYFGRRVGYLAGWLLLINPVWWYEASRPFMPNTLFAALTIISAWFMLVAPLAAMRGGRPRRRWDVFWLADGAVAGAIFGLALAVRLSEVYWLALAAAALIAMSLKKVPWMRLALSVFFAAAVLLPFLGLNRTLYGSWIGTGYGPGLGGVPVEELPAGYGARLLGGLQPYLFPLGFAPQTAFQNFWTYGVKFFWWWSVLVAAALIAAAVVLWRRRRQRRPVGAQYKAFALAAALAALWLILFYGSWPVRDNPDPRAVTIGTSYFRYWLPVFVLSVVPVAWALQAATASLSGWRRPAALIMLLAALTAVSGYAVFTSRDEGLLAVRANLIRYDQDVKQVLAATEPESLIIVDRADKLLFPDRRVIYPLRSDATYAALPKLRGRAYLYYYGITLPEADLEYLRSDKLPPLGLTIEPVLTTRDESLYRLRPLSAPSRP